VDHSLLPQLILAGLSSLAATGAWAARERFKQKRLRDRDKLDERILSGVAGRATPQAILDALVKLREAEYTRAVAEKEAAAEGGAPPASDKEVQSWRRRLLARCRAFIGP
jgi:hypothetical protein